MMLILDLDDTIFETKSMNPEILDSAISIITEYYISESSSNNTDEILSDMWSIPIDQVFLKYATPDMIVSAFYRQIEKIDFKELDIQPFDDYAVINSLPHKKVLVTTGLKELQFAKIKALGIEEDFDTIYIDDPRIIPRQYKINIFKQLLHHTQMAPSKVWVIGDNPDSEIKAGRTLGLNTIQRKSTSKTSSELADYTINTFEELKGIIG